MSNPITRRGFSRNVLTASVGVMASDKGDAAEDVVLTRFTPGPQPKAVWLDGVRVEEQCIEMDASPYPGKTVHGRVVLFMLDSEGVPITNGSDIHKVTKTGMVRWEPLE